MQTIEKIKKLLIEYEKETSLENIVNLYNKLSLYSIFLAETLSTHKNTYNTSYYKRKLSVSHSYINNKKEKITDKMAIEKSIIENKIFFKQELENESITIRLENFLRQVNRVLDAMRTKVSFLKTEQNRTKQGDII